MHSALLAGLEHTNDPIALGRVALAALSQEWAVPDVVQWVALYTLQPATRLLTSPMYKATREMALLLAVSEGQHAPCGSALQENKSNGLIAVSAARNYDETSVIWPSSPEIEVPERLQAVHAAVVFATMQKREFATERGTGGASAPFLSQIAVPILRDPLSSGGLGAGEVVGVLEMRSTARHINATDVETVIRTGLLLSRACDWSRHGALAIHPPAGFVEVVLPVSRSLPATLRSPLDNLWNRDDLGGLFGGGGSKMNHSDAPMQQHLEARAMQPMGNLSQPLQDHDARSSDEISGGDRLVPEQQDMLPADQNADIVWRRSPLISEYYTVRLYPTEHTIRVASWKVITIHLAMIFFLQEMAGNLAENEQRIQTMEFFTGGLSTA